MKAKEEKFISELDVFRTEVESAIQFFYAAEGFKAGLRESKKAQNLVNRTPLFWRTTFGALQQSFFISLGRIFDQTSKHNVDRFLKVAQENIEIFSKPALEARKRADSANANEWIDNYMTDVYVPDHKDFRRLRGYISKYRRIYECRYRDFRRKVYAHKELSKTDTYALFAKTSITETQKMIIFLNRLHSALWQLFHNGRKPVLRPMKYSTEVMRRAEVQRWKGVQVQERIVADTKELIKLIEKTQQ
ncbi:MAG: hypothetical protein M0Z67_00640 [Nitrospiraceae bacterium]|nr:hypothetical protein [Nitrospiraceae bacterium]